MKGVKQGQYPKSKVQCWVCGTDLLRHFKMSKRFICKGCNLKRILARKHNQYLEKKKQMAESELYCNIVYGKCLKYCKREAHQELIQTYGFHK